MAPLILKDLALWVGGYDVAGDHNQASFTSEADVVETTTFGSNSRTYTGGLLSMSLDLQGLQSLGSGEIEDVLSGLPGVGRVVSFAPVNTEGSRAYLTNDLVASYTPEQGSVGDIATFTVSAQGSGDMAVGIILENGGTARTETFDGTAYELGAVAAGETLYAALHVLSVSGSSPTLDVIVESDEDDEMGDPSTQITFAQADSVGAEWKSKAGAITDTYYRVGATIGGSDPSFLFVVTVGIR
jgi:hypothetical protein